MPLPSPDTPQTGAYCSYIMGHCAVGHDVKLCAKRNPVECRNCRQKNEASQKEAANARTED